MSDCWHTLYEVSEQPAQVPDGLDWIHASSSLSVPDDSSLRSAARPSRAPRWKLAIRCLVVAAERVGAGMYAAASCCSVTPPGTKFACWTRLGRPAGVRPAAD